MPSFYEISDKKSLENGESLEHLSTYNSGTMINRYYHPYAKKIRLSTSSSLNAAYINHPILSISYGK